MALLQELILSCADTISLNDLQTGSVLATFKQCIPGPRSTACVTSRDGQGGLIFAAQADKPLLSVFSFQKDQILHKMVLPEKLSCLAVDDAGYYCAGGTSNGRIYLWEIASGVLFNSWTAHYRHISALRFTRDGAALISGSEDSGVSVWLMARLLDLELDSEIPAAYCSLSDHTLPITDIVTGQTLFPSSRLYTASLDHSVKIWTLSPTNSLLTTFVFPQPISNLALDPAERFFFAASSTEKGEVYQVRLFRRREQRLSAESVGGMGIGDAIRIGAAEDNEERLITVGQTVTTMSLSMTGHLLVGTLTGHVKIYDVPSHQLLRTITIAHQLFPITHLSTITKPPDLIGHVSLGGVKDEAIPVRPVSNFGRVKDLKIKQTREVPMMLPIQAPPRQPSPVLSEDVLAGHRFFVQATSSNGSSSLENRVVELEAEVSHLREQLNKAKGLNDSMWETFVHGVVGHDVLVGESDPSMEVDEDAGLNDSHRRG